MNWQIRHEIELLSAPTTVNFHRIDTYSSIVEGVQRVRRILRGSRLTEDEKLIQACSRNDIETVKWLFDHSDASTIDLRKGINRSALHEAVLHRDSKALVRLLCQYGADPRQRDSLGRTPIHYAASKGHTHLMTDLIHYSSIDISTLVDSEGRCPLMYACGEGHLATCQWLVEYTNADFCREDDEGRTCLVYASRNGHANIVKWLLSITIPQSTYSGWHPLHFACSNGHLEIIRLLLNNSNEKIENPITNSGHSALFMAMHSSLNTVEMVKYLLDSNLSIQLTLQDVEDLKCNKSLIFLYAQHRHSLIYLLKIIAKLDYPLSFIRLLLLSEHIYSTEQLLLIPRHQSYIRQHLQNPLRLKHITRCLIRKSIDTSKKVDRLEISQSLKKFIHFESFY